MDILFPILNILLIIFALVYYEVNGRLFCETPMNETQSWASVFMGIIVSACWWILEHYEAKLWHPDTFTTLTGVIAGSSAILVAVTRLAKLALWYKEGKPHVY